MKQCPCCGGASFKESRILRKALVREWRLSRREHAVMDRQQGFHCTACGNNLRAMALADAIVTAFGGSGTLADFVETEAARALRVLEINPAGKLTPILSRLPGHRMRTHPDIDMMRIEEPDGSYDLVVHSDTLEHVELAATGLSECARVLADGGRCAFTAPMITGRLSSNRFGLAESSHQKGVPGNTVYWEFGADAWRFVLEAGFRRCVLHCLEYPAGIAFVAET